MKRIITIICLLLIISTAQSKYYDPAKVKNKAELINGLFIESQVPGYINLIGANNSVIDEKTRGFALENPFGIVMLNLPKDLNSNKTGALEAKLKISYTYELNGKLIAVNDKEISLKINKSTTEYKSIDYVKIVGALLLKVEVVNIIGGSNFDAYELTTSCRGERYDFIPFNAKVSGLTLEQLPSVSNNGNLDLTWDPILSFDGNNYTPEVFELEWTYISESITDEFLRDYLFKNNSSRVVVSKNKYSIPLVYEQGIIFYRIRAVGYEVVQNQLLDIRTEWTIDDNKTSYEDLTSSNTLNGYYYEYSGLEIDMNWQSTITFAEEGKNKAVVSYHDGTLRNRQALTRVNTDQRVVVGETFYDYNGRPIIQVLPVPVSGEEENNFDFRPNFNIKTDNQSLSKDDYESTNCDPLVPQLNTSTGASQYYSANNGFGVEGNTGNNILNRNLIADAEKYPFTQIRYRSDNTDRVVAQSGVGSAHILGSAHDTKYMYAAPTQSELTRLFGTQVGSSGHYKKNAVIDPNGQVSVSYLNPEGKVVATALAGNTPTSLTSLTGPKARAINDELLDDDVNNLIVGNVKKFSTSIPVTSNDITYIFEYKLDAEPFNMICEHPDPSVVSLSLKAVGVYDVSVELIKDDCKEQIFIDRKRNIGGLATDLDSQHETISFTKTLSRGTYTLSKILTLNEQRLLDFQAQYLADTTFKCIASEDYFIKQVKASNDISICDLECEGCNEKVQAFIDAIADKGEALSDYAKETLFATCENLCLENYTCAMSLELMLADMYKDGQYAQITSNIKNINPSNLIDPKKTFDVEDGAAMNSGVSTTQKKSSADSKKIAPELYDLSIFNPNSKLRIGTILSLPSNSEYLLHPSWKKPVKISHTDFTEPNFLNQIIKKANRTGGINLELATYQETDYYDDNGTIIYADVTKEDNVYSPEIDDVSKLVEDEYRKGQYKIPIKYLKNVKDFIEYWDVSFANYFIPYHPEYTYYINCLSLRNVNIYGEKLMEASAPLINDPNNKFFNFTTTGGITKATPNLNVNDPIFSDSRFSNNATKLTNKMTNYVTRASLGLSAIPNEEYLSMVQFANYTTHCGVLGLVCENPENICTSKSFALDDEVAINTYKALYLSERDAIIRDYSHIKAIGELNYNGCMGVKNFGASTQHTYLLKSSPLVTVDSRTKLGKFAGKVLNQATSVFVQIGGRVSKRIQNRKTNDNNYILPWNVTYVHTINPLQQCGDGSAYLFEEKNKAFFKTIPGYGETGSYGEKCYEFDLTTNSWVLGTCYSNTKELAIDLKNLNDIKNFQSCSLCPLPSDIKEFVTSVFNGRYVEPALDAFNCLDNETGLSVGSDLEALLNSISGSSKSLYNWSYVYSNRVFTGRLHSGTKLLATFDVDLSSIPISSLYIQTEYLEILNLMKISSLVPRSGTEAHDILNVFFEINDLLGSRNTKIRTAFLSSSNFEFKRFSLPFKFYTNQQGNMVEVTNLGAVCTFDPICRVSSNSEKVVGLLNALTAEYQFNVNVSTEPQTSDIQTIGKTYDLNRSLVLIHDFTEYDYAVRNVLQFSETVESIEPFNIKWETTTSTPTVLEGKLTYPSSVFKIKIENYSGAESIDFTSVYHIERFSNPKPFKQTIVGTSSSFIVDAFVKTNVEGEYKKYLVKVSVETQDSNLSSYGTLTKCTAN